MNKTNWIYPSKDKMFNIYICLPPSSCPKPFQATYLPNTNNILVGRKKIQSFHSQSKSAENKVEAAPEIKQARKITGQMDELNTLNNKIMEINRLLELLQQRLASHEKKAHLQVFMREIEELIAFEGVELGAQEQIESHIKIYLQKMTGEQSEPEPGLIKKLFTRFTPPSAEKGLKKAASKTSIIGVSYIAYIKFTMGHQAILSRAGYQMARAALLRGSFVLSWKSVSIQQWLTNMR